MFKFERFKRLLSDDNSQKEEKILAGRDLRKKSNSLELTVSSMTQTAVNELFVEKLSRPNSVSNFTNTLQFMRFRSLSFPGTFIKLLKQIRMQIYSRKLV